MKFIMHNAKFIIIGLEVIVALTRIESPDVATVVYIVSDCMMPMVADDKPDGCMSIVVDDKPDAAVSLVIGRRKLRHLLVGAMLWCVMAVLIVGSVTNASSLREFSAISLRYDVAFSGLAAYQLRRYSIERESEDVFWPTFWHETSKRVVGELRASDVACLLFSGDAALVWPARYLAGAAPGIADGFGCAVSSALAQALWGGTDVVGKTVKAGGHDRVVRGVFEGDSLLILLSFGDEDTRQSFSAIELTGGPSSPTRSDAEMFVISAGLGKPDSVLMGTPGFISSALSALPLSILALYILVHVLSRLRKRPTAFQAAILFALLGFAFLLPGLLEKLPAWLIPTRWSDFSFWGVLSRQIGADLREYLSLTPRLRDIEYSLLFCKQVCFAFLSMICALLICFRRHCNHRQS